MNLSSKEKRARAGMLNGIDEANYREMEKHCPVKVRYTTRQPVFALEYQKRLREMGKEDAYDRNRGGHGKAGAEILPGGSGDGDGNVDSLPRG